MDSRHFDNVARLFGLGASRRRIVAALVVGAGGSGLGILGRGSSPVAAQCVPGFKTCLSDDDCCTPDETCFLGACGDPATCGGVAADPCEISDDCCGYLSCTNSICTQECQFGGESCVSDEDCCAELGCGKEGTCTFCFGLGGGSGCADDTDCCGDLVCDSGVCSNPPACAGEGDPCSVQAAGENGACCAGLVCNDGTCESICSAFGDECGNTDDCCSGLICATSTCVECAIDDDCDVDHVCQAGVCEAAEEGGHATITIHKATCPHGTGDIFGDCHDNALGGVAFDISGFEVGSGTVTTGGDGVATANVLEAAATGDITLTEDPGVFADYLGAYVYCSEQNSGTVLYDGSADTGSVTITARQGDDIICDWYNITEPEAEQGGNNTGGTTLPSTGSGPANGGTLWWPLALAGGAAAAIARRLRSAR